MAYKQRDEMEEMLHERGDGGRRGRYGRDPSSALPLFSSNDRRSNDAEDNQIKNKRWRRSLFFVVFCITLGVSVVAFGLYVFFMALRLESVAINLSPSSASSVDRPLNSNKDLDINAKLYSTKHYSWPTMLDLKVSSLQCKMEFLGSGVGSSADGLPSNNFIRSTSYSLTHAAIDEVKVSELVNSNLNIYLDSTDYSNFRAVIWDYVSMSAFSMDPAQSPKLGIDCSFDVSIVSKFIKFEVESPRVPASYQHTLDLAFDPFDFASLLSATKGSTKGKKTNAASFSSSSSSSSSLQNDTATGRPCFKINSTNAIVQKVNKYCGRVTVFSRPVEFGFNMSTIQQYSFTTDTIDIDLTKDENLIFYNSSVNEKYVENSLFVTGSLLSDGAVTTTAEFGSSGFLENFVGDHSLDFNLLQNMPDLALGTNAQNLFGTRRLNTQSVNEKKCLRVSLDGIPSFNICGSLKYGIKGLTFRLEDYKGVALVSLGTLFDLNPFYDVAYLYFLKMYRFESSTYFSEDNKQLTQRLQIFENQVRVLTMSMKADWDFNPNPLKYAQYVNLSAQIHLGPASASGGVDNVGVDYVDFYEFLGSASMSPKARIASAYNFKPQQEQYHFGVYSDEFEQFSFMVRSINNDKMLFEGFANAKFNLDNIDSPRIVGNSFAKLQDIEIYNLDINVDSTKDNDYTVNCFESSSKFLFSASLTASNLYSSRGENVIVVFHSMLGPRKLFDGTANLNNIKNLISNYNIDQLGNDLSTVVDLDLKQGDIAGSLISLKVDWNKLADQKVILRIADMYLGSWLPSLTFNYVYKNLFGNCEEFVEDKLDFVENLVNDVVNRRLYTSEISDANFDLTNYGCFTSSYLDGSRNARCRLASEDPLEGISGGHIPAKCPDNAVCSKGKYTCNIGFSDNFANKYNSIYNLNSCSTCRIPHTCIPIPNWAPPTFSIICETARVIVVDDLVDSLGGACYERSITTHNDDTSNTSNTSNTITTGSATCNLRACINALQGSKGTCLLNAGTHSVTSGLMISNLQPNTYLTIAGSTNRPNDVVIDGQGQSGFAVSSELTSTLVIKNVTVRGFTGHTLLSPSSFNANSIGWADYYGNSENDHVIGSTTTGCVDRDSQGGKCCNGAIEIDSSVTSIRSFAFAYCSITSVLIPDSVTTISYHAFYRNRLTSISIPSSVTYIYGYAFALNQISSLILGSRVRYIGAYAFSQNQLSKVMIPNNVETIEYGAFSNECDWWWWWDWLGDCSHRTKVCMYGKTFDPYPTCGFCVDKNSQGGACCSGIIHIARNITSIADSAFDGCSITSVDIPNSVESIGRNAFANNKLSSLIIPDSVSSIGQAAFANNKLSSVALPGSVHSVGNRSFDGNSIYFCMVYPDASFHIEGLSYPVCSSATVSGSVIQVSRGSLYIKNAVFADNKNGNCAAVTMGLSGSSNMNSNSSVGIYDTSFLNNQADSRYVNLDGYDSNLGNVCGAFGAVCVFGDIQEYSSHAVPYDFKNLTFVDNTGCVGSEAIAVQLGNITDGNGNNGYNQGSMQWYSNGYYDNNVSCLTYDCLRARFTYTFKPLSDSASLACDAIREGLSSTDDKSTSNKDGVPQSCKSSVFYLDLIENIFDDTKSLVISGEIDAISTIFDIDWNRREAAPEDSIENIASSLLSLRVDWNKLNNQKVVLRIADLFISTYLPSLSLKYVYKNLVGVIQDRGNINIEGCDDDITDALDYAQNAATRRLDEKLHNREFARPSTTSMYDDNDVESEYNCFDLSNYGCKNAYWEYYYGYNCRLPSEAPPYSPCIGGGNFPAKCPDNAVCSDGKYTCNIGFSDNFANRYYSITSFDLNSCSACRIPHTCIPIPNWTPPTYSICETVRVIVVDDLVDSLDGACYENSISTHNNTITTGSATCNLRACINALQGSKGTCLLNAGTHSVTSGLMISSLQPNTYLTIAGSTNRPNDVVIDGQGQSGFAVSSEPTSTLVIKNITVRGFTGHTLLSPSSFNGNGVAGSTYSVRVTSKSDLTSDPANCFLESASCGIKDAMAKCSSKCSNSPQFTSCLILLEVSNIALSDQLSFSKETFSWIVQGNQASKTTIAKPENSNLNHRVLYNSGELTLENVAISGGYAQGYTSFQGAGIYNAGNLTIIKARIENNRNNLIEYNCGVSLDNHEGGGIFNKELASIKLLNVNFRNNGVNGGCCNGCRRYGVTSMIRGGALFNSPGGIVSGSNVKFDSNYATNHDAMGFGGAIYNEGTIDLDNIKFISNYVRDDEQSYSFALGGAIYNANGRIVLKVVEFLKNYAGLDSSWSSSYWAPDRGGALYLAGGEVEIYNGSFTGNRAYYDASSNDAYISGGTLRLDLCSQYSQISNNNGQLETSLACLAPSARRLISNSTNPSKTMGCIDKSNPSSDCCSGDIEISSSITIIADGAYEGCSITSVDIPNSIESVGHNAFANNKLSSVILPSSVQSIDNTTFDGNSIYFCIAYPDASFHTKGLSYPACSSATVSGSVIQVSRGSLYIKNAVFSDNKNGNCAAVTMGLSGSSNMNSKSSVGIYDTSFLNNQADSRYVNLGGYDSSSSSICSAFGAVCVFGDIQEYSSHAVPYDFKNLTFVDNTGCVGGEAIAVQLGINMEGNGNNGYNQGSMQWYSNGYYGNNVSCLTYDCLRARFTYKFKPLSDSASLVCEAFKLPPTGAPTAAPTVKRMTESFDITFQPGNEEWMYASFSSVCSNNRIASDATMTCSAAGDFGYSGTINVNFYSRSISFISPEVQCGELQPLKPILPQYSGAQSGGSNSSNSVNVFDYLYRHNPKYHYISAYIGKYNYPYYNNQICDLNALTCSITLTCGGPTYDSKYYGNDDDNRGSNACSATSFYVNIAENIFGETKSLVASGKVDELKTAFDIDWKTDAGSIENVASSLLSLKVDWAKITNQKVILRIADFYLGPYLPSLTLDYIYKAAFGKSCYDSIEGKLDSIGNVFNRKLLLLNANNMLMSDPGAPTNAPTFSPTNPPSWIPSASPTKPPSASPSQSPTSSARPTARPTTFQPTASPTIQSIVNPTIRPTAHPTADPSFNAFNRTIGCIDQNTPSRACCSGVIEIDTSISSIASQAFWYCALTNVTIGSNIIHIEAYSFAYLEGSLKSVEIPDSVLSIGDYAFYEAGLHSVTLSSSVANISASAFYDNDDSLCFTFSGNNVINEVYDAILLEYRDCAAPIKRDSDPCFDLSNYQCYDKDCRLSDEVPASDTCVGGGITPAKCPDNAICSNRRYTCKPGYIDNYANSRYNNYWNWGYCGSSYMSYHSACKIAHTCILTEEVIVSFDPGSSHWSGSEKRFSSVCSNNRIASEATITCNATGDLGFFDRYIPIYWPSIGSFPFKSPRVECGGIQALNVEIGYSNKFNLANNYYWNYYWNDPKRQYLQLGLSSNDYPFYSNQICDLNVFTCNIALTCDGPIYDPNNYYNYDYNYNYNDVSDACEVTTLYVDAVENIFGETKSLVASGKIDELTTAFDLHWKKDGGPVEEIGGSLLNMKVDWNKLANQKVLLRAANFYLGAYLPAISSATMDISILSDFIDECNAHRQIENPSSSVTSYLTICRSKFYDNAIKFIFDGEENIYGVAKSLVATGQLDKLGTAFDVDWKKLGEGSIEDAANSLLSLKVDWNKLANQKVLLHVADVYASAYLPSLSLKYLYSYVFGCEPEIIHNPGSIRWEINYLKNPITTGCVDRSSKGGACCYGNIEIDSSVTSISDYAFSGCSITSVIFPDSVTSIASQAFYYNRLTSVTIPSSVTYIGDEAFYNNQILSLSFGDSVTYIGYNSFYSNRLSKVVIPASVQQISNAAFDGNNYDFCVDYLGQTFQYSACSIDVPVSPPRTTGCVDRYSQDGACCSGDIEIDSTVSSIHDWGFSSCSITSVIIPDSVTYIGFGAFFSNQISSLILGNNVAYIETDAFNYNRLISITIPSSVTYIGEFAFYSSSVTPIINIPKSVKYIGDYAFGNYNDNKCLNYEGNIYDSYGGNFEPGSYLRYPACGSKIETFDVTLNMPEYVGATAAPTYFSAVCSNNVYSTDASMSCRASDAFQQYYYGIDLNLPFGGSISYSSYNNGFFDSYSGPLRWLFPSYWSWYWNYRRPVNYNRIGIHEFLDFRYPERQEINWLGYRTYWNYHNSYSQDDMALICTISLTCDGPTYVPDLPPSCKTVSYSIDLLENIFSESNSLVSASGQLDQFKKAFKLDWRDGSGGRESFEDVANALLSLKLDWNQLNSEQFLEFLISNADTSFKNVISVNDLGVIKRYFSSVSNNYVTFLSDLYPPLGKASMNLVSNEKLLRDAFNAIVDLKWVTGFDKCKLDYSIFNFLRVENIDITSKLLNNFHFNYDGVSDRICDTRIFCIDRYSQDGACCSGDIEIESSVTSIGSNAFYGCSITSVIIPTSVEIIGSYAFAFNRISSLTLGHSVESIEEGAFYNNLLSSVTIPKSVQLIGNNTFDNNKDNFCLRYLGAVFQYPRCVVHAPTFKPTVEPTHRPTRVEGRPAKGIKFRGDRGDEPPAFAAYHNMEETSDRNPHANVEYHCFEHEARYVRGTYGMRGYFEGKLNGHTAYINFFEITNDGETLTPTTGSAAITYAEDWSSVDGPFWSTGSSTMPGSWGRWGAHKACSDCYPDNMSMKRIRKEKCLWSDNEHSHYEKLPDLEDRIMGTEQTANNWFNIGYGPSDTRGQTVGSYHYRYTKQQCNEWGYNCLKHGYDEVGSYGAHSVSANVKGGRILASNFRINSGPLSGHIGSGLYSIFNYEDGSVGYAGYFCVADWVHTSGKGDEDEVMQRVLVDCAYDTGDEMAADSKQAVELLGSGYNDFGNFYSNDWHRLSKFFQYTKNESDVLL